MKKKTIEMLILILTIIAILMPTHVNANSFKLNATANKNTIKEGETVTITLKLSNIDVGTLGINTVEGMISYDTNIFEEITQASFTSLNNWSLTYNGEETEYKGKILGVILASGVTEDQEIGKIKLKVKENVSFQETSIFIKNITTNDGEELIKDTDKEIKLKVGTKVKQEDNTNNTNNNNNTTGNTNTEKNESTSNTSNNKVNKTNANTTKSKSDTKLPYTGLKNVVIVSVIIALIIGAIYQYKKYKTIDK